jgi:hypothetical protein
MILGENTSRAGKSAQLTVSGQGKPDAPQFN